MALSPPLWSVRFVILRHVFSQDFQDQEVPGQETKAESAHSPMDSDENW